MPTQQTAPGRSGHVLVVGNLKGGSGKSTLVVNLACAMTAAGRRVAIVDCDPQGSAQAWASRGLAPVRVHAEPLRSLDKVPEWLDRADWLRAGVDVLVIDLPAVVAPAMAASFLIASMILIPLAPTTLDIEGTRRVLALLEAAAKERANWPPRALLVPTRVRELDGGLEDWRARVAKLGLPMTSPLHQYSEFDTAIAMGSWVGDKFRGSRANHDMKLLTERVLVELDRVSPRPPPVHVAAGHPFLDAPVAAPWWRRLFAGERLRTAFGS